MLLLESHYSDLDGKVALRPYVYAINQGRLKAKWRGTALAYPLTDIAVPPDIPGLVCGLHTQGSFLMPQEGTPALKLAYRWNGFGFSLSKSLSDKAVCEAQFPDSKQADSTDSQ
jgi:poly-gamma-glutamate synthesis protein (capsule biosynthesis protein)